MAIEFPQRALQASKYPRVPPLFMLQPNEYVRLSVIDPATMLHSVPWRVRLLDSREVEVGPRGNLTRRSNYLSKLAGASEKVLSIVIPMYSLRSGPGFPFESGAPEPLSLWPSTDDDAAIKFDVWFAPPGAPPALTAGHPLGIVARCQLEDGSGMQVSASAMASDAHCAFVASFISIRMQSNLAKMSTIGEPPEFADDDEWGKQQIHQTELDGVLTFVDTKL